VYLVAQEAQGEDEVMKVKELIEKLQDMDQDAVVVFFEEMDSSGGWRTVDSVTFEDYSEGTTWACLESSEE